MPPKQALACAVISAFMSLSADDQAAAAVPAMQCLDLLLCVQQEMAKRTPTPSSSAAPSPGPKPR